ncbi:hypothetical protein [Alkalibacterium sp. m-11]
MKEWTFDDHFHSRILIDKVTILKGKPEEWKDCIHYIREAFLNKKVDLREGNERLNSNDFQLNIMSYSDSFPLTNIFNNEKQLLESFYSYMELSPIYKQFVESWEDLQEEVQFLNDTFGNEIKIQLNDFSKKMMKKNISTEFNHSDRITEFKQTIKLAKHLNNDKQNIFFIISPEDHFDLSELEKLDQYLQAAPEQFIVITSYPFRGMANIVFKEKVINHVILENYRSTIQEWLPFVFDPDEFDEAKNWYIDTVDKSDGNLLILSLSSVDKLTAFIYLFLLVHLTHIPYKVDYTGIPDEFIKFIDTVTTGRV